MDGAKGMAAVVTATEQIAAGDDLASSPSAPIVRIDQEWMPRSDVAREQGRNRATAKILIALTSRTWKPGRTTG